MVNFTLQCDSALCSDSDVSSFIESLQDQLPSTNIHFVRVWAHEVTLLLCSDVSVLNQLQYIEGATINEIRPSDHCSLYESL